jgi:hypothetical protein
MRDPNSNGHRPAKTVVELPETVPHEVPAMPSGDYLPETVDYWQSIWRDPISVLWADADHTTVGILIDKMDSYFRARNSEEKPGSRLTQEIRALRGELGLTPRGRMTLLGRQKPQRIRPVSAPVSSPVSRSKTTPASHAPDAWKDPDIPDGYYRKLDGSLALLGAMAFERARPRSVADMHTGDDLRGTLGHQDRVPLEHRERS